MAITQHNLKRWTRMILGKSSQHVNQDLGKIFSKTDVKGYYNNLIEKVYTWQDFDNDGIPTLTIENKKNIYFPIAIFQYALGAYDLFLLNGDEESKKKFEKCLKWTIKFQNEDGSWENFKHLFPKHPFSAMAQGEAISLLIRGYIEYGDETYFMAAQKAIEYMLKPIEQGGTTLYINNHVYFQEVTHLPTVLNGWIFALFGIHDYLMVKNDYKIKKIYELSIETLVNDLVLFDNGIWSKYDLDKNIASPFYHKLHIAQLQALYLLTGKEIFKNFSNRWIDYEKKKLNKVIAFFIKVVQKILE